MSIMTGGQAIVAQLLRHGVDTVFALPGVQTYPLIDALHTSQASIRTITPRHEQGASTMAFGAARSTGRPAVCSVVPGPGLLNAGAGLLTAFGCNAPVLCITGQVPSDFLGRGRGHLHEMPDQLATVRGFVKWAERIDRVEDAPALVSQAFQEMTSGRPGPACLEMTWDGLESSAEVSTIEPLPAPQAASDFSRLDEAVALIRASKTPMIFVGGGAQDAGAEILELARRLVAPVVGFRSGKGIVSDDDPLGCNIVSGNHLWRSTDLMIGIGTRLELADWRWNWSPSGVRSIRIDIDPAEFARRDTDVDILADSSVGVRALLEALEGTQLSTQRTVADIQEAKALAAAKVQEVQPQVGFLEAIREVLPRNGFFCDELSQVGFASWYGLPIYEPRTFVSSGYQGTLGAGFMTGLGVKAVNPDRAVVSVSGDGGFMFGLQELATAVTHRLATTTVVFNNGTYENVRRDQMQRFDGRVLGVELGTPDLVALAHSFGAQAARVRTPEELRTTLDQSLSDDLPWVIEVPVPRGSEANPWPLIHPAPPTP